MDFSATVEHLGDANAITLAGAAIGLGFGFFGQRSRFCMRSAVIEFSRGTREGKLTVWLFAFATAVLLTQLFVLAGWLDVTQARQLTARGSLSGAAVGGALFGVGMILARGCSSRLLVLAAQGNLRALLSGLMFAVAAQSAAVGLLSPLRLEISNAWTVDGGQARDLLALTGRRLASSTPVAIRSRMSRSFSLSHSLSNQGPVDDDSPRSLQPGLCLHS